MQTRKLVLTEQEETLIARLIRSGRYRDVGEIIRDGLVLIAAREDLKPEDGSQLSIVTRALSAAELDNLQALIVEVAEARERAVSVSLDEILAWRDEGRA